MSHADALAEQVERLDERASTMRSSIYNEPNGMLQYPYLQAGSGVFEYLVDWDAIWSGMSYLIDGDPAPLQNSLLNILDHIDPDGKGQRVIQPDGYGAPVFQNRPFVAVGAFVLTRELGSSDWLPEWGWRNLRNYLRYWHTHRTGEHGLLKWLHVGEGFADNGLGNWTFDTNSVEAVDLNAQLVAEHAAAAYIADVRGLDGEAAELRGQAETLATRIRRSLWDDEDDFFYSSYDAPEWNTPASQIRCVQYTNLWPLWIGLPSEDRAERIIESYVLDAEQFWSDYGIRSMARSEPMYNNAEHGFTVPIQGEQSPVPVVSCQCSNWQGPIWSPVNYLVPFGLKQYGYDDEARTVTERIVRLLANDIERNGTVHENYDAETGEPLANAGIGSWTLFIRHLPEHIDSGDVPWMYRGLDLPSVTEYET